MVDQERMKEYIAMGMTIDDALKLCQEEDIQAKKDAAKEAKAAAASNQGEQGNNEGDNGESDKNNTGNLETQFVKKEDIDSIVKETVKGLKDDEEFKKILNNEKGEAQKERTVDVIIEEAVNKMRTGK